jgi:hydrogenase/urease accessory protein HupE
MKLRIVYITFSFLVLGCILKAHAHEIRPAFLQIMQVDSTTYNAYWKIPRLGEAVPKIYVVFPDEFKVESLKQPSPLPGFIVYGYKLSSESPLFGKRISIDGLNRTLIDALVNINFLNGEKITFMLQPDKPSFIIPEKETLINTIKTYLKLGTEHILLGIDHLLFVLALLLITPGFKKLIKTITAFTIAHSITLSLSALGFIGLPGPPVEAVIALSIVFLAVELMHYYKGEITLTVKHPWIVAFTFGLLHGFGFAGALANIGLPQTTIPSALLFFNVGVEFGQILFILCILSLIWIIKKTKISIPKKAVFIPVYAIGSIASYWLIERVLGFWI